MGTSELLVKLTKLQESDLRWTSFLSRVGGGGVAEILLAASCYRTEISPRSYEPVRSKALLHCTSVTL